MFECPQTSGGEQLPLRGLPLGLRWGQLPLRGSTNPKDDFLLDKVFLYQLFSMEIYPNHSIAVHLEVILRRKGCISMHKCSWLYLFEGKGIIYHLIPNDPRIKEKVYFGCLKNPKNV